VIRYLITDGSAKVDPRRWLAHLEYWMKQGVDFVQIREPEMSTYDLATLVREVRARSNSVRILVNDRGDVAIATGADGVHLRDGSIEPNRLRFITTRRLIISVACHNVPGAVAATRSGADYVVLAPVFDPLSKAATRPPLGLEAVREAAASVTIPVVALGGITPQNARDCVNAGAAGVAGITLFSR
jgi:thiamine-phosphate diphosphorylase